MKQWNTVRLANTVVVKMGPKVVNKILMHNAAWDFVANDTQQCCETSCTKYLLRVTGFTGCIACQVLSMQISYLRCFRDTLLCVTWLRFVQTRSHGKLNRLRRETSLMNLTTEGFPFWMFPRATYWSKQSPRGVISGCILGGCGVVCLTHQKKHKFGIFACWTSINI